MKRVIMTAAVLFGMILMTPAVTEAKKITSAEAAKKLARSEVKGGVVTEVDTDYENGKQYYDVSLVKGSREYSLSYRASNGKLTEYEWETVGVTNPSGKKLTKSEIKKRAKKEVKKGKVTQVTTDMDDGVEEYKVTMKKSNKTYKLVYTAKAGKLVEYKWKISGSGSTSSKSKYIGEEKAKSIAKNKVPGGTFTKVEFDTDDGVPVYEIEMVKGSMEYELTIHAKSGKILEYDSESKYD